MDYFSFSNITSSDLVFKRYLNNFFGCWGSAIVKTLDAAVLGAVVALVRACMAWVQPQAKALRNFSEDYFSVMDGKR